MAMKVLRWMGGNISVFISGKSPDYSLHASEDIGRRRLWCAVDLEGGIVFLPATVLHRLRRRTSFRRILLSNIRNKFTVVKMAFCRSAGILDLSPVST